MAKRTGYLLCLFGVIPEVAGAGLLFESGDVGFELAKVDHLANIA